MGFIGTVGSWFLMPHFGRQTPYLWGQIVMFTGLIIIGGLGIRHLSTSTGWAIGALMLMLTLIYDFTIGPVCYSLVAGLPSTRLQIKTVVLARTMYNFTGILIGILQPRFMNPTAWNWGGKAAFFWAGCNLCGLVWTCFRLPEPKGLTYAELDVLFENKVNARKFRIVEVDPYRSDNLVVSAENDGSDQGFTAMEKH
jgi:MFS transporter, SP family, general alpha glucoside:H+ symporter